MFCLEKDRDLMAQILGIINKNNIAIFERKTNFGPK